METRPPLLHGLWAVVWADGWAERRNFDHLSIACSASSKTSYMKAWENDFQFQWGLDSWSSASLRAYKGIQNVSLIEANLKVLTRWYLTLSKLFRMFPSANPLCFRGCEMVGSMAHVWWECPRLRSFWKKVFNLIFKVTGLQVPRTPEVALLNACIPKTSKLSWILIHFIFLGATGTLAKAWKQPRVSFLAVICKVSWIMIQEKLSSILLDTKDRFELVWEPWARFVGISFVPGISSWSAHEDLDGLVWVL